MQQTHDLDRVLAALFKERNVAGGVGHPAERGQQQDQRQRANDANQPDP